MKISLTPFIILFINIFFLARLPYYIFEKNIFNIHVKIEGLLILYNICLMVFAIYTACILYVHQKKSQLIISTENRIIDLENKISKLNSRIIDLENLNLSEDDETENEDQEELANKSDSDSEDVPDVKTEFFKWFDVKNQTSTNEKISVTSTAISEYDYIEERDMTILRANDRELKEFEKNGKKL